MRRTSRATPRRRRTAARLTCAALAVVSLGAPATAIAAGREPDRLLDAYPLEQRPATVADVSSAPPRGAAPPPAAATPDRPGFSQGTAIAIAAGAMLLAGLVVVRPRRRSVAPELAAAPAGVAAPPGDEPPLTGWSPPRRARVCQVHWARADDASWFEAVTQGRDRRTIAVSPDFDWDDPHAPPDRSPDAQAALRALVDDLREAGWTPARGRGRESGAPRWYARRFHATALVDDDTEDR